MLDVSPQSKRKTRKSIGPIGTVSRVLVGLLALYLALLDGPPFADGLSWSLRWYEAVLGLVVLPAIAIAIGLAARRHAQANLRFTGELGLILNCAVIVALVVNPYTAAGALLFYGLMMLIAA